MHDAWRLASARPAKALEQEVENMKRTNLVATAVAAAILAIGAVGPAQAQSAPDPHHPAQGGEAQPDTNAPQLPIQNDPSAMMGMMRMMNMAQMMQMMGAGGMAGPAGAGMDKMDPAGMAMIDHVEGRIAFLRAELKITDAQAGAWEQFATALRDNAKRLAEVRKARHADDGSSRTLQQRLAAQEQWLGARLEGVRAIKATFGHLYTTLSPDQQKSADELLAMHMGLMPGGMQPMGMMQMGGATQ
jgi:hypothetical protein